MVRVNVSQQLKVSIGSIRDYTVREEVDTLGDGGSRLVQGELRLIRTDRGILDRGTLDTEVGVTCSRCLSLFNCPLALNIEEEYFPTTDVVSGISLPVSQEPGGFTIDEHHMLDLTEAIRQYALLALPMKLLCQESCAGLCPSCGHNLNQGACNCPPEAGDPRWPELNELASVGEVLVDELKEGD